MDYVALIMLAALPFTGVLTIGEALAGFSDANIILIAALFVIGEGLVRSGVARKLGDWLIRRAGTSETRLIALLMIVVCALGATMSSTAVTAIFIPVALRIAQTTGSSPGRLMMPLSVAALISGMTTLIATAPNLVVNSELVRHLQEKGDPDATGFHFFAFTPFGVPVLIVGIAYMLFARRWLPAAAVPAAGAGSRRPSLGDWTDEYGLAERESRLRVTKGSPLAGAPVEALDLRESPGASVVAVERGRGAARAVFRPAPGSLLQADDVLLVDRPGPGEGIEAICKRMALEALPLSGAYFNDRAQQIGMAEVIVPADSDLAGQTTGGAWFRAHTGLTAIGLRRGGAARGRGPAGEALKVGDTLLVVGPWTEIERLQGEDHGVVITRLPADIDDVLPVAGKAPHAVFCLLLVVGLMIAGVIPNVHAAILGCLLMGALGVIDLKSAYRSIDWKTIVLIVGMLPFSMALQRTGGVDLMADGLMAVVGGAGTHVVLASLFAVTAILGLFISNTATAVLMAPVAIAVSDELGASPYPFAMIVALGASTAFMTPVSSPVNTLVVTPGNYTFGNFVRVGTPLGLLVLIITVIMVPLLLPP
jgi:di/tricarboxylate transporter